jgi:protein MpaA
MLNTKEHSRLRLTKVNALLTAAKPYAKKILAKVSAKRLIIASITFSAITGISLTAAFYWPRQTTFSYSGETCFNNPVLLPATVSKTSSKSYDIVPANTISIGGYPIYTSGSCIKAMSPPREGHNETIRLRAAGMPFTKTITVASGQQPKLAKIPAADKLVSTQDPLTFTLGTGDVVFKYVLEANGKQSNCTKNGNDLECNTQALALAQAQKYDFTLWRTFGSEPAGKVFSQAMTTVEPVQLTGSTIAAGQVVYDTPTEMQLTLNKPARKLSDAQLLLNNQPVPITTRIEGNKVFVSFSETLARSSSFTLTIEQIEAPDGGLLNAPINLVFQTSGGPKVSGVSIGSAKVSAGSPITLTFDTALAPGQDLGQYIKIESSGAVAATLSSQGRTVTIRPAAMSRCAAFTVKVLDGLKNEFGVSGNSAWSFKSRILCQSTFSIGTSVQGRSITGYRFGDGPNKIIFVGGTHGDERSSVQILQRWIDTLEMNPSRIPAHQTIIIIPIVNPDGYAANSRTNANNVDLNRNFPSNNWKSGVTMPNKTYLENGGGTAPLSEPESRALASYTLSQSPRLVLTYHAAGDVVVPNDSGDSNAIAVEYGKKSTVGYMSGNNTGTFFEYDTTGAYEDWLRDKHGLPALLIELSSRTSNDFNGHLNALWYIAGL